MVPTELFLKAQWVGLRHKINYKKTSIYYCVCLCVSVCVCVCLCVCLSVCVITITALTAYKTSVTSYK